MNGDSPMTTKKTPPLSDLLKPGTLRRLATKNQSLENSCGGVVIDIREARSARLSKQETPPEPTYTDFERWFVRCVMYDCEYEVSPVDYLWDMQNPGIWLELFKLGLSPQEAVHSQFLRQ